MNNQTLSTDERKKQWRQRSEENLQKRKLLIRARSERRQERRRAPVAIVVNISADNRDQAERACQAIHGMPLVSFLHQEVKTLAESPEGYISEKELNRKGFRFSKRGDIAAAETITALLEQYDKDYPDGITMNDLYELWGEQRGDRSTTILFGRIMKNLGYRKHRTYMPATDDAPAKLGWVYRKEESEPWLPPAA